MNVNFDSSPIYSSEEIKNNTRNRHRVSFSRPQLILFAKQNLQYIQYDIDSANILSNRRFAISNFIASLEAIEEEKKILEQANLEYQQQIQKIQQNYQERLQEADDLLKSQELEQKEILKSLQKDAHNEEKKAQEMSQLEMQYYQEQAEYELYKECSLIREEYERERQTLRSLQEEQKNINLIKAKLENMKTAKNTKSLKQTHKEKIELPSARIAYLSNTKKKRKK
ncbi:hypothetical protein GPJ56_001099 [Histomonas meleagridis]|uniref:uncharacterized protein n=1 Tax=Histomonas meleagridis TaxID=135588 RepID=UPI00355A95A6|nr:hypothetical protein GPJ56_001099 [Histomonas meleagridis]KAH0798459.1 hypothetical protein GO595_008729 [Histomonas meleagridis]